MPVRDGADAINSSSHENEPAQRVLAFPQARIRVCGAAGLPVHQHPGIQSWSRANVSLQRRLTGICNQGILHYDFPICRGLSL